MNRVLLRCLPALLLLAVATSVLAQGGGGGGGGGGAQAGGVEVNADGVLRTLQFRDPRGFLTRERIASARISLGQDVAKSSKLRKISLNRLEAVVGELLAANKPLPSELRYLAGLNKIKYVFFLPETKDIVIAGPAEGFAELGQYAVGLESGQVVMELQDLIVALRAFSPEGQRTHLLSVSIDASSEGLSRLQKYLKDIAGKVRPNDGPRIAAGMKESLGLHNVTVRGISPKTHFAQVMVEADYRMKLIGIGLEQPPVPIENYVSRANPRDISKNAMQRWYFTPNYECVMVAEDNLAMELVGEGVKLISEDELVQASGQRVGVANTNKASQAFCAQFTQRYPELAKRAPVFGQLRNLIDLSIAAAFIQQKDYFAQADWRMPVFSNEQLTRIENYTVPKHVDSAVNVIWKGSTMTTPIGGGVKIQPLEALKDDHLLKDEDNRVKSARAQVSVNGLPAGRWWWD